MGSYDDSKTLNKVIEMLNANLSNTESFVSAEVAIDFIQKLYDELAIKER